MTLHLRANKGDYAPTTLLVGDPARSVRISQLLQDSKMVNKNRHRIEMPIRDGDCIELFPRTTGG